MNKNNAKLIVKIIIVHGVIINNQILLQDVIVVNMDLN